jgi:hypothetical protein
VPVHRCNGWPWILENAEVCSAVVPIPLADFVAIATSEDVEAVLEIDPRRKDIAVAGEDDWVRVEVALQPIERVVKLSKEAVVLNVDLVGIHGDDRAVVHEFDTPRHGMILPV